MAGTKLKPKIKGRWAQCIRDLAPEFEDAIDNAPHHCPCPIHGGKDGFRFFPDVNETGGGICNTCGAYPNGFSLLKWARGWNDLQLRQALNRWLVEAESKESSKKGGKNDKKCWE